MTMSSPTLRSPSPKKQRKPRTESGSSTVSPCSREVRDLVRNSRRCRQFMYEYETSFNEVMIINLIENSYGKNREGF